MNYLDDKLRNFTKTVMKEALDKREEIINKSKEEKDKRLAEKENQLLEEAYNKIQNVIRKTSKEKNEKISCAIVDSRKTLFYKRQELINNLFNSVEERIHKIKNTKEYNDFLVNSIQKGIEDAGSGEITVYIDKTDGNLIGVIKDSLTDKYKFAIEIDEDNILGGCRIINQDKKILIDLSLNNKLEEEKKKFLKSSGIQIQ